MTRNRTLLVALLLRALAMLVGGAVSAAPSARTAGAAPAAAGGGGGGGGGGDSERGGPNDPNCEDGISNDDDAFIDAADPDCQKPGCQPSSQTPNKCFETNDDDGTTPPPEAGNCSDGIDNDEDGATDGADSDCQAPGCVVDGVNTCDEVTEPGPGPAELCVADEDAGLLTDDTLAETAWNSGLDALSPLTEDPERNGVISGPVGDAFNAAPADGTPFETILGDEVPCLVDLLLDETVSPVDL